MPFTYNTNAQNTNTHTHTHTYIPDKPRTLNKPRTITRVKQYFIALHKDCIMKSKVKLVSPGNVFALI